MRIDPKGMIAQHPALVVRDCLRKLKVHTEWDLRVLEKAASVEPGRGRALARALRAEGLIKRVRPDTWTITQAGQRFSSATAAKPVSRVTAERVLCEFLERVDRVNRDAYFLGRVNRVVLFGSMLRPEVAVLSDLDLAVEIVPKNGNWDQLQQENQERVEELVDRGRKFRNILEIYAHWHREVFRFLKSRSRVVSLADYAAEKSLILRRRTVCSSAKMNPRPSRPHLDRSLTPNRAGGRVIAPFEGSSSDTFLKTHLMATTGRFAPGRG